MDISELSGSWILWSNDTKMEDEISGERVDIVIRGEYYERNEMELIHILQNTMVLK